MAVGADVAPPHPARIGPIPVRTKLLLRVNCSPTSSRAREQRRQGKGKLLAGLGGVLTRFTVWLVGESSKRLWGFGDCGLELAHRGSTLWPQPRQNHTKPEPCAQQASVKKQVVSPLIPLPS
jgi:hypothetical protein